MTVPVTCFFLDRLARPVMSPLPWRRAGRFAGLVLGAPEDHDDATVQPAVGLRVIRDQRPLGAAALGAEVDVDLDLWLELGENGLGSVDRQPSLEGDRSLVAPGHVSLDRHG